MKQISNCEREKRSESIRKLEETVRKEGTKGGEKEIKIMLINPLIVLITKYSRTLHVYVLRYACHSCAITYKMQNCVPRRPPR